MKEFCTEILIERFFLNSYGQFFRTEVPQVSTIKQPDAVHFRSLGTKYLQQTRRSVKINLSTCHLLEFSCFLRKSEECRTTRIELSLSYGRQPVDQFILVLGSSLGPMTRFFLSNAQSSWLQIRRPGFDSQHYQKKKVVSLERGPLSLVSTTEELLDRKVAAPV
jgi:hypothetical protein